MMYMSGVNDATVRLSVNSVGDLGTCFAEPHELSSMCGVAAKTVRLSMKIERLNMVLLYSEYIFDFNAFGKGNKFFA